MGSVQCEVWSVEFEVWSVKREVRSGASNVTCETGHQVAGARRMQVL